MITVEYVDQFSSIYHRPPPRMGEPHRELELIFEAAGELEEIGTAKVWRKEIIRIIQRPELPLVETMNDSTMVHAFLTTSDVNVPLLPDQEVKKIDPNVFILRHLEHEFKVTLDQQTAPELLAEFEKVLEWFTSYQGPPTGTQPGGVPGNAITKRLSKAGEAGVAAVDKIAGKVSEKVDGFMEPKLEAARAGDTRNVNIGGKATRRILGKTRKVVGKTAGAADKVTDKASDAVGSILANNPIMKALRKGKKGTTHAKLHNTVTAGMAAAGKVYVAADERSREIVSTAGENSSEVLEQRYGDQVADAAKDSTRIALDSYKIFRFPASFGASALIKGAAKAAMADKAKTKQ